MLGIIKTKSYIADDDGVIREEGHIHIQVRIKRKLHLAKHYLI